MQITVKLFGTLRRLSAKETPGLWQGEVSPGTTILELIGILGTVEAEVAAAAIDGQPASLEAEIPPGGVVILVTPVNGGSGGNGIPPYEPAGIIGRRTICYKP